MGIIKDKKRLIEFLKIESIKKLIQEDKWGEVFTKLSNDMHQDFAEFLLLDCGINCLKGMKIVPNDFFNTTEIREILIPKNIYSIGKAAFYNCDYLKKVEFEKDSTCKYFGASAFQGCNSLEEINLPESLEGIAAKCFDGCKSLTTLIIPKGVKYLIDNIFRGCTSLKSITIECEDFSYLGQDVFNGCISLNEIKFNGPAYKWKRINKEQGWRPIKQRIIIKCDDEDIIYGE